MGVSDLLSLIGVLLAVTAFVSERNREYIFFKFSNIDVFCISISFLFVHFLISYSWWREKFTWFSMFENINFPTTGAWAYLVSLVILIYSVLNIFFIRFPYSKLDKILQYYKKLLLNNDVVFLAQLIEKYHIKQIITYLTFIKNQSNKKLTGLPFYDNEIYEEQSKKISSNIKLYYGASVYHSIISNDLFIENITNKNPYIFSKIIMKLDDMEIRNINLVNKYLKYLILNKNINFFREVRETQNEDNNGAYVIEIKNQILYSLFSNILVSSINCAWTGIGEQAILEMEEEAKKSFSPLRELNNEQDNDTIWTYRIQIAIYYFDIMVRQAISQKINDHMWLMYYEHFVTCILSNMPNLPLKKLESNRKSRNYNLIERIFKNMMSWKKIATLTNQPEYFETIYDCAGACIYSVSATKKLRIEDKAYLINWMWEDAILTFIKNDDHDKIYNTLMNKVFEMFKRPHLDFDYKVNYSKMKKEDKSYIDVIKYLWKKRDKYKFSNDNNDVVSAFKSIVVDKLIPNLP